ncbi:MAG: GerW family sporulation protein [Oscillospiraceae bacterium]|nr:GerW family sporulation protein [Oscillospiraceae bacterium]
MENLEKKTPLNDMMDTAMGKIREMVDSNSIIGEPITTPDGVTVIPISRVSFGFGTGGGDYGTAKTNFGGGAGAAVKVDPVAFLIVKDGVTRVMPVAVPAVATVDRVLDLVPEVMDRVENFINKKKEEKEIY